MAIQKPIDRLMDLENAVSDLQDALELARQEHHNELSALRAKVEAMEHYRQQQIELTVIEREMESLTEQLALAQRRRSALSL